MSLTIFGLIALLVGGYLVFQRGLNGPLIFIVVCSLFGGAAALRLPALGGSTIPPAYFALAFLALRIILSPDIRRAGSSAVYSNQLLLIAYCLYTAVTAMILPKIFAGQMNVSALRVIHFANGAEKLVPLGFSSQNLTTAVYIIGALATSLCTMFVCLRPQSHRTLVPAMGVVAACFVASGVIDLVLSHFGHRAWLDYVRNASYAQLDQNFDGIVRIQGFYPEPSTYASYGFAWFIFMMELWLRDVRPRLTGLLTVALGVMLVASTSSSAYVSLAVYGLLLFLRILIFQRQIGFRKGAAITLGVVVMVSLALLWAVLDSASVGKFSNMVRHMTLDKSHSQSGTQRLSWMMQGVHAFVLSHGLGVGAGSFRSSSLFTAIAGSSGVVGLLTFHLYLLKVFKPFRASTYAAAPNEMMAAGAAAAWAAVIGLIPAEINAASADPSLLFAIFAGMALAWRLAPARAPQTHVAPSRAPAWRSVGLAGGQPARGIDRPSQARDEGIAAHGA